MLTTRSFQRWVLVIALSWIGLVAGPTAWAHNDGPPHTHGPAPAAGIRATPGVIPGPSSSSVSADSSSMLQLGLLGIVVLGVGVGLYVVVSKTRAE